MTTIFVELGLANGESEMVRFDGVVIPMVTTTLFNLAERGATCPSANNGPLFYDRN